MNRSVSHRLLGPPWWIRGSCPLLRRHCACDPSGDARGGIGRFDAFRVPRPCGSWATVHVMTPLARSFLVVVVLMLVAGCSTKPAEPAPPPTAQSQADVPPPLVPAMALPENAVDNAVAKLDRIADELMKKSGIPGMAVAVVHGGKTTYAKGFGVRDVRTGDKVDP